MGYLGVANRRTTSGYPPCWRYKPRPGTPIFPDGVQCCRTAVHGGEHEGEVPVSGDKASSEGSETTASGVIDRRGFLQLGGFAVAITASGLAFGGGASAAARTAGKAVGTVPAASGTLRIGVPNYPASWDQDYGAFD